MKDDEFFTHASDKKGHSVSLRVRVPTELQHAMDIVFDKRGRLNLPYSTKADIIRDAIAHRLDWLKSERKAPIKNDLVRFQAIEEILQQEQYDKAFSESLTELRQQVNWLLGKGDKASREHAAELVNDIYQQVHTMEGYWRDQMMQALKTEFAGLIKPWSMKSREEE